MVTSVPGARNTEILEVTLRRRRGCARYAARFKAPVPPTYAILRLTAARAPLPARRPLARALYTWPRRRWFTGKMPRRLRTFPAAVARNAEWYLTTNWASSSSTAGGLSLRARRPYPAPRSSTADPRATRQIISTSARHLQPWRSVDSRSGHSRRHGGGAGTCRLGLAADVAFDACEDQPGWRLLRRPS